MEKGTYDVMLSIYVPVYNHEKYIAQALDSILMQKTQYSFEVLVGEDASTDRSKEILQYYEKKHPGFFQMFYREHNMHREPTNNAMDLLSRCRGKYIIPLESDDFWIDENKIEKQITFLEEHPEYLAVAHNCIVVDDSSQPTGEMYPECKDEEYTIWHYAGDILPGQTTTMMFRNYLLNDYFDKSFLALRVGPGDRKMFFTLVSNGRVFCMQEAMSAYRHVITHGSSYSANLKYNYEIISRWYGAQLEYAYKISNLDAIKCAELQYVVEIRSAILKRRVSIKQACIDLKLVRNLRRAIVYAVKRDIMFYGLKKKTIKLSK